MPKILFPTDLSEAANHAFVYALHLADKLGASIVTLHAYDTPIVHGASTMPHYLDDFYRTVNRHEFQNHRDSIPALDQLAREHGFTQVPLSHTLHQGDPVPTIIERARAEGVDYIVMGTTGAQGIKEVFLGTIAGEILENAPCPVLAVPVKATFDGRIDQVAFTTTYQPEEKAALDRLLRLTEPFGATVHCINVDLAHTEFHHQRMETLRGEYAGLNRLQFHVLQGNKLEETITRFLEEHRIDFIAMVTHRRTFLQELFHFSQAKHLSYHSKTPVMSFPVEGSAD